MVKFIKKFVFITINLIINFLFFTYRIIHKFFVKNKSKIKETLLNIDEVLKRNIALWWISLKKEN